MERLPYTHCSRCFSAMLDMEVWKLKWIYNSPLNALNLFACVFPQIHPNMKHINMRSSERDLLHGGCIIWVSASRVSNIICNKYFCCVQKPQESHQRLISDKANHQYSLCLVTSSKHIYIYTEVFDQESIWTLQHHYAPAATFRFENNWLWNP